MNILHLTHTDIKSDSRILKEMTCLDESLEGFSVFGIGVHLSEENHKTKSINNIKVYSISLYFRKWRKVPAIVRHALCLFELTFKMLFRSLKLKPKVVHCHDVVVLPLGVLVKIFSGAKLVYDAHELESDRNGLTKVLQKITLFVERMLWGFVDVLLVVSPSIEKWYQRKVGKKPSEVIMNSPEFEEDKVSYSKNYLREKFSISEDEKIFIYVGILGRGRGIEPVLDAFNRTDLKAHVVFLGYGEMDTTIRDLGSQNRRIHFHPAVPHTEVVPVVKSADFGLCFIQKVSLSDYYCLPNKLFEYAFARVPVLASDFPDLSQVIDKYKLGKCCSSDAESIFNAIKELSSVEDPINIDIKKLYPLSWKAQEEKLFKIYSNLISTGS